MAAVAAALHRLHPQALGEMMIATTRWIVQDETSDINFLVQAASNIPIVAVNLNFGLSKHRGLRAYEEGVVKEGVGAGGTSIAAILKSENRVTCRSLERRIEKEYSQLVEGKLDV